MVSLSSFARALPRDVLVALGLLGFGLGIVGVAAYDTLGRFGGDGTAVAVAGPAAEAAAVRDRSTMVEPATSRSARTALPAPPTAAELAAARAAQIREAAIISSLDGPAQIAAAADIEPVAPPPPPAPEPPSARERAGETWWRLAVCESGGDPRAVSPSGRYRGAFQFDLRTWASVGMSGDPIDHSFDDQLAAAQRLHAQRGFQPWPACRRTLGLP